MSWKPSLIEGKYYSCGICKWSFQVYYFVANDRSLRTKHSFLLHLATTLRYNKLMCTQKRNTKSKIGLYSVTAYPSLSWHILLFVVNNWSVFEQIKKSGFLKPGWLDSHEYISYLSLSKRNCASFSNSCAAIHSSLHRDSMKLEEWRTTYTKFGLEIQFWHRF